MIDNGRILAAIEDRDITLSAAAQAGTQYSEIIAEL
jgi:N-acetyl-beta-hexosaminidase